MNKDSLWFTKNITHTYFKIKTNAGFFSNSNGLSVLGLSLILILNSAADAFIYDHITLIKYLYLHEIG